MKKYKYHIPSYSDVLSNQCIFVEVDRLGKQICVKNSTDMIIYQLNDLHHIYCYESEDQQLYEDFMNNRDSKVRNNAAMKIKCEILRKYISKNEPK